MRLTRTFAAGLAAAASLTALAACGSGSEDSDAAAEGTGGDGFPVTVEHTYGKTTIESAPKRVAAVSWANHEVPLALGVVPVGMSKATWGDDDKDGVLPWVETKLEELDAKPPVLFDETEGIDFEAVADTRPDVILASYSGLTKEEYETLSKIAPVVAYPKVAWGTSMQDMITMNSKAIGKADEGAELIEELDGQIADAVAERPQLEGKSVVFSYVDPADLSQVGYYTTHDTRPAFLAEIGMTTPKLVADSSAKSEEFFQTISAEKADELADSDIVISYGDAAVLKQVQADPLLAQIPAVKSGAVAMLQDDTPLAAVANPSPLSIEWGLGDYLDILAGAADKAS